MNFAAEKTCSRCGETKPLTAFNRYRRAGDGRQRYCRPCNSEYHARRLQADPTTYRSERRRSYFKHHDARRARAAAHYLEIRDKRLAYMAKWRSENRERFREFVRNWRLANPHKSNRYTADRRARLLERMLPLAPDAQRQMDAIYAEAKARRAAGEDCHVDHEVPLQGKTVCGLHVPWNLQIITRDENLRKSNRFDGDSA